MAYFSLFQILIFGIFCAIVAALVTALQAAVRRSSLRYQLRVARQAYRHASHMLTILQESRRPANHAVDGRTLRLPRY